MSTTSWTTPISPARTSSYPATPSRVTPRVPDESETMRSYVSPLQRLVTAAKRGDTDAVPSHASQLSARIIRLTGLAESAAETLKPNTELARYNIPNIVVYFKKIYRIDDMLFTFNRCHAHSMQMICMMNNIMSCTFLQDTPNKIFSSKEDGT